MTFTFTIEGLFLGALIIFCSGWLVAEGCAAWRDRHPDNLEPLPTDDTPAPGGAR